MFSFSRPLFVLICGFLFIHSPHTFSTSDEEGEDSTEKRHSKDDLPKRKRKKPQQQTSEVKRSHPVFLPSPANLFSLPHGDTMMPVASLNKPSAQEIYFPVLRNPLPENPTSPGLDLLMPENKESETNESTLEHPFITKFLKKIKLDFPQEKCENFKSFLLSEVENALNERLTSRKNSMISLIKDLKIPYTIRPGFEKLARSEFLSFLDNHLQCYMHNPVDDEIATKLFHRFKKAQPFFLTKSDLEILSNYTLSEFPKVNTEVDVNFLESDLKLTPHTQLQNFELNAEKSTIVSSALSEIMAPKGKIEVQDITASIKSEADLIKYFNLLKDQTKKTTLFISVLSIPSGFSKGQELKNLKILFELLESSNLSKLSFLGLGHLTLTSKQMEKLSTVLFSAKSLQGICLIAITNKGLALFAKKLFPQLTELKVLKITKNTLDAKDLKELIEVIPLLKKLTDFSIAENPIGPSHALSMINAIYDKSHVTKLNLSGCEIRDFALIEFALKLHSFISLVELDLSKNHATGTAVLGMLKIINDMEIKSILLSNMIPLEELESNAKFIHDLFEVLKSMKKLEKVDGFPIKEKEFEDFRLFIIKQSTPKI